MSKRAILFLFCVAALTLILVIGCSDDKTTTPTTPAGNDDTVTVSSDTTPVEMADFSAIVEEAAPPEYVAPSGSPSAIDSAWQYGQSPLLNTVFGSNEPQALYRNIEEFTRNMEILGRVLRQDGDGNIITGSYDDSALVDMDGTSTMAHFTATVNALSSPTAIPTAAQTALGATADLDYEISIAVDEMTGGSVHFGLKLTETEQTLLLFDANNGDQENQQESSLKLATLDLTDSSFAFKGVGYVEYTDTGEKFLYAFDITSESSSDFSYRESWFSNATPGITFRHSVIGGGNKDVEFALKYRMFAPADTTVADTSNALDQVFGPNYTEGTGLISGYSQYLSDGLIFGYAAFPQAMLADPWD